MKSFLSILCLSLFLSQGFSELKKGDLVPAFETLDDQGESWNLLNQKGWLVVYFYPAAMTGGCTKQACSYRDGAAVLKKNNITVVGVSGDNVEGLKAFKKAENLNFTLLSDFKGDIAKTFGVPMKKGGKIERTVAGEKVDLLRGQTSARWTFVINPDKEVAKVFQKVNPQKDFDQVLKVVSSK
jgi:peroxiredoxin Q/BCP